jgi:hypothetical protein
MEWKIPRYFFTQETGQKGKLFRHPLPVKQEASIKTTGVQLSPIKLQGSNQPGDLLLELAALQKIILKINYG